MRRLARCMPQAIEIAGEEELVKVTLDFSGARRRESSVEAIDESAGAA